MCGLTHARRIRRMPSTTRRQGQFRGQGQRAAGVRIGSGAHLLPGPNPGAQWYYLQAVAEYVPDALRTLAAVFDEGALHAWAQQWGFEDAWALDVARRHVALWQDIPTLAGRWHLLSRVQWAPVIPPMAPWDPTVEREAGFDARVKAYKAAVKASPLRPARRVPLRHFEWLARHHVARLTYAQIATRDQNMKGYPDEPAVSDALRALAPLVGVTLRPGRGRKLARPSRH